MHRTIRAAVAALGVAVFAAAPALARPQPTPTPIPTPVAVADPAVTHIVRQQFVSWQAGTVDKSLYSPQVLAKMTDAKVNDVSRALAALGALTDIVYVGPFSAPDFPAGARGYIYQMLCTGGKIYLWIVFDGTGKIATIYFKDRLDIETIERPGTPVPSPPP